MFIKSEYITLNVIEMNDFATKPTHSEKIILYLFPIACESLYFEILNLFSKLKHNFV